MAIALRTMTFRQIPGFAVLPPLLSGCIPSAQSPDLALDVPSAYRAPALQAQKDLPSADWWTNFHSAELNLFMRETEIGNFDIAAAAARIIQADTAARVTGAALLPSLTGNASITRSKQPAFTAVGGGRPRTIYLTTLNASYIVDFWGKNRSALQAGEETAFFRRWDSDTVALTVLASTATTYLAVVGARERISYAQEDLQAATRILNLIKERVKFGTATALIEAQQEALVENLRASIPPLQQISDQNVAMLGLLMGRVPERVSVATNSLEKIAVPRIAAGLPSQLLIQRPDVQAAEAQLASAHADLVSARAAFFPQIQLTGQGGFESLAFQSLFSPASGLYSVAAALTQPIFDGGMLQANFDQRKGVQDELLADYHKAIVSAFTDVEKALIAMHDLAKEEATLRQSLAASRRAFSLAEEQLRAGTVDYVTVLQTQQTLFTTLDTLSQVRLSHLQAAVTLYQALGGGWYGRTGSGT
jgi:NodT family efflux transporter outer membrane factor (OMF) lipoprotein